MHLVFLPDAWTGTGKGVWTLLLGPYDAALPEPPNHLTPGTLYDLLPEIVRAQARASIGTEDDTETILYKLVAAIENELDLTGDQIRRLGRLLDADRCDPEFMPWLLTSIGGFLDESWSEKKKRLVLRGTMALWHAKGTRASVEATLRLYGLHDFTPIELWKHTYAEIAEYVAVQDYEHAIRAARIQLEDETGTPATAEQIADRMAVMLQALPIHILPVRVMGPTLEASASLYASVDESVDILVTANPSSETTTGFTAGATLTATYISAEACRVTCQTGDQTGCVACETGCEEACEYACQIAGEVACVSCEMVCEAGCESACEASCESYCEVSCQSAAEYSCLTGCEVSCESFCQTSCETTDEVPL